MRRRIFFFLLFLLTTSGFFANPVAKHLARKAALNYIEALKPQHLKTTSFAIAAEREYHGSSGQIVFYLFQLSPSGFIVVSADDLLHPIVGYSLENTDAENTNPAFEWWLKKQAEQADKVLSKPSDASAVTQKLWQKLINGEYEKPSRSVEVEPLLTSQWNQGQFYNQFCPADAAGPDGHAVTGCVATAMGQIMYYHRFPYRGKGFYSYQHNTYGTISADFENSEYRYNEMTDKLTDRNPAVALLLHHCGVAVDMVYGPNGSGMYNHKAAYALKTHFRFVPETRYVFRDSVTLNWDSLIVDNLLRGLPMYYAGWEADSLIGVSGHAFVCDGVQNNNYFHFNWGWGGSYDGYFYTGLLNPAVYDFNWGQELIVDIIPDTSQISFPLYCSSDTLTTTQGSISDGSEALFNYPNNTDCFWLIKPSVNVEKIILTFKKFSTEENADWVRVYDGGDTLSTLLGSFSGNSLPPQITSTGKQLLIRFKSNDSITAQGFFAIWKCVFPVYCSGTITYTAVNDTIEDGSGQWDYNNNSNCKWLINVPGSTQIRLEFIEFETEASKDQVKVYDASSTPAVLLGTFSGNALPPVIYCNSSKMMITFLTNATNTFGGWKAVYSASSAVNETDALTQQTLFPNPAAEYLTLYLTSSDKSQAVVTIFDSRGQTILSQRVEVNVGANSLTIPIKSLNSGLYFISASINGISRYYKFIKQ